MIKAKYAKFEDLFSRATFRAVRIAGSTDGAEYIKERCYLTVKSEKYIEEKCKKDIWPIDTWTS